MKNLRSNVNLEKLLKLYEEGDWREVLALVAAGSELETEEDCFFSWIRPTEENLLFLASQAGDTQLVSVGCGSGLLEWLIQAATGIKVIGMEMDRGWWEQPHSPPKFLPLNYFEETSIADLCSDDNRPITLLFCYFNNTAAFDDYMRSFEGDRVIIIGPGDGRGTHTAPAPFAHTLPRVWSLNTFQEVGDTKDFIAVYTRQSEIISPVIELGGMRGCHPPKRHKLGEGISQ